MVVVTATVGGTELPATPVGWTRVAVADAPTLHTVAWRHTVAPGEPGTSQEFTRDVATNWVATAVAYDGVDPDDPVVAAAASADSATADHLTPALSGVQFASMLLVWSDKSTATTGWTLPPQVTQRATEVGAGAQRLSVVVADSAGPYAQVNYPQRTATTDAVSSRGAMLAIALRPDS